MAPGVLLGVLRTVDSLLHPAYRGYLPGALALLQAQPALAGVAAAAALVAVTAAGRHLKRARADDDAGEQPPCASALVPAAKRARSGAAQADESASLLLLTAGATPAADTTTSAHAESEAVCSRQVSPRRAALEELQVEAVAAMAGDAQSESSEEEEARATPLYSPNSLSLEVPRKAELCSEPAVSDDEHGSDEERGNRRSKMQDTRARSAPPVESLLLDASDTSSEDEVVSEAEDEDSEEEAAISRQYALDHCAYDHYNYGPEGEDVDEGEEEEQDEDKDGDGNEDTAAELERLEELRAVALASLRRKVGPLRAAAHAVRRTVDLTRESVDSDSDSGSSEDEEEEQEQESTDSEDESDKQLVRSYLERMRSMTQQLAA
jgi:hypothetical protein